MQLYKKIIQEARYPFENRSRFIRVIILNLLFMLAAALLFVAFGEFFEQQSQSMNELVGSLTDYSQNQEQAEAAYSTVMGIFIKGIVLMVLFILAQIYLFGMLNSFLLKYVLNSNRESALRRSGRIFFLYVMIIVLAFIVLMIPIYPMLEIINLGGRPSIVFILAFYALVFLLLHLAFISTLGFSKEKGAFRVLFKSIKGLFRRFWAFLLLYLILIISFIIFSLLLAAAEVLPAILSAVISIILLIIYIAWAESFAFKLGEYIITRSKKANKPRNLRLIDKVEKRH